MCCKNWISLLAFIFIVISIRGNCQSNSIYYKSDLVSNAAFIKTEIAQIENRFGEYVDVGRRFVREERLDKSGNILELVLFGDDEKSISKLTYKYRPSGELSSVSEYDGEGVLQRKLDLSIKEGHLQEAAEYDENGDMFQWTDLQNNLNQLSRITVYDSNGKIKDKITINMDSHRGEMETEEDNGAASIIVTWTLDENGEVDLLSFISSPQDEMTINRAVHLTKDGKTIELSTKIENGTSVVRLIYDSRGRLLEQTLITKDFTPEPNNANIWVDELSWNKKLHLSEIEIASSEIIAVLAQLLGISPLDISHTPPNHKNVYDKDGQLAREEQYDTSGQLEYIVNYEYDTKGNWVRKQKLMNVYNSGKQILEPTEAVYRTIEYSK